MIVPDTNVLSEPLRAAPEPRVLRRLRAHASKIAISAISVAELRYGADRLPGGARRNDLDAAVRALIVGAADQALPFDTAAAEVYGQLRHAGRKTARAGPWKTP